MIRSASLIYYQSQKKIQFQFPIRILRVSDAKKNNKKVDY